jgi:hypothetical protein
MNKHIFVICGLFFFAGISTAQTPAWQPGDGWPIRVSWAFHEKGAEAADMNVVVLGEDEENSNWWKLEFNAAGPPSKTPDGESYTYILCVDKKDGWPRQAFSFVGREDLPLATFGDLRMFTTFPQGYPTEFIPDAVPMTENGKSPGESLTVKAGSKPGQRIAIIRLAGGHVVEVRQTWVAGEKWWRDYERYRDGKLELRASRVIPEATKPARLAPPPAATPGVPAPPMVDLNNNPLKADARLSAKLSLNLLNPRVQDLLDRLAAATGLTFRGDPNVDFATPVFVSFTSADNPAWTIMDQLAQSAVVRGSWEKQEDGSYLLKGGPKLEAASSTWKWWLGGIVAVLAGTALVVFQVRRR